MITLVNKQLVTIAAFLSLMGAELAQAVPNSLFFKCTASQSMPLTEQPCGGTNSKELRLSVALDGAFDSGFRLKNAYGGCFSTTTDSFGVVDVVQIRGDLVDLRLRLSGYIDFDGIPRVHGSDIQALPIDAVYDSVSNLLTINAGLGGVFRTPNVLTCRGMNEVPDDLVPIGQ